MSDLHGPQVSHLDYCRWMLTRMEALAEAVPSAVEQVQPMIEHWQKQIAALEAVEAISAAPTDEMTMGYQKSATGAYRPRSVDVRVSRDFPPVGNEHRTRRNVPHTLHIVSGQRFPSSSFWPDAKETYPGGQDIRIDPPYDR